MPMTSSRPYMLRALYEWIVDNECTPYILVDARGPGVEVPLEHVNKDGQIVLNLKPSAVKDLTIQDYVSFSARFSGIPTQLFIPCGSVLGIYARENGQGMVFEPEHNPEPPKPDPEPSDSGKRPSLRVVK
ncbi:ClpXP protease specificity-enhancing factor [Marinimicrobium sp. ABcell2]|uniref:ClpXP protease specificity-enhancing factor n=1 Tax=Marinimicrobium sp. ABcell2 TaxID=3069751 RepID=UPI0027B4D1A1|nr:ClpXP protease specificity-enhancing factor [Marinimicrobium sp. ABcell2]MDQ2078253.1 ClpXP protease specificity-enhancing factor [Marinimicrobium sp. ABcell2]